MPSPATDAESAPAPALDAVSEVQEEEEEEEVEQAEEFTVTGEGTDTVEAGRDALGNDEEEESEAAAAEVALEDSGFQADIGADSTEDEVRKFSKRRALHDIFFRGWFSSGSPPTSKCSEQQQLCKLLWTHVIKTDPWCVASP